MVYTMYFFNFGFLERRRERKRIGHEFVVLQISTFFFKFWNDRMSDLHYLGFSPENL